MAKSLKKIEAIKLRKSGYSLYEISQKLFVSKASVSTWVRDIVLSKKSQDRLSNKIKRGSYLGRIKGSQTNKTKKEFIQRDIYHRVLKENSKITNRELLFLGIALFWAEGNKKGSRFIFSNSDFLMLKLILKWLVVCMDVLKEHIYISIQINEEHRNREEKIIQYWQETLKIEKKNILGPYYIKRPGIKFYKNKNEYFGVVRIQVRKSSVLQYKILGYIRVLTEVI
jgi:hypothetical protein